MATINANTKFKVSAAKPPKKGPAKGTKAGAGKGAKRGEVAPLAPASLSTPAQIDQLKALDKEAQKAKVMDLFQKAKGAEALVDRSKPHAASTTKDRAGAAADVATAARELGVAFVLKECSVLNEMQRMLFPEGIQTIFSTEDASVGGLKPSASAVSLSSLDNATASTAESMSMTVGTDSKRGKTTPANAREGSLLVIRALCEIVGRPAEPYVVGAFLAAALDECGSNSSSVREAAEDTAKALVRLANPWSFPCLISPLIAKCLKSTEWRVKSNALDRLAQCAETSPTQVCKLLPKLIPMVTGEVWDTKLQVTKSASAALLAICQTNQNQDVKPAIPAVVNAICKPADTNKAIEKLMGTTFVVTVDASTLAILCPVLSRSLKEKLAIHKRAACLVISNMSKLVGSPQDVAPFGPLLVPELKKVANSVQFEEIRDEALKALNTLTKALGDMYSEEEEKKAAALAAQMAEETRKVEEEQKRIEEERQAILAKEAEIKAREEEERRRFKEAMDAQRELDKIAEEEAKKKAEEEAVARDKARRSTKGSSGKCQGCGLKKCKKTCMFYSG
eukprot:Nitzschia sp. Nitz4//scaffold10_size219509//200876//202570//NITZ4_001462-RA/size219509-processed-gene-0.148-mRNA-1//-1//CDS//3329533022//4602//frame0